MSLPPVPSLPPAASSSPADPHRREYWCFISYRHADNKKPGRQWATWLHQALETYEVPADLIGSTNQRGDVIPERIFPVFRDEEELPADAHLSTPIDAALRGSRFLVVLCSPQAVQSTFVAEEILRFKQLGKHDRILAAILEGEPNASDSLTESETAAECFPVPLRYHLDPEGTTLSTTLRAEPIAADFRLPDGTQGWTTPGAYREALQAQRLPEKEIQAHITAYTQQQHLMLLKIVAGVLGVPLGVLTQRDKAYQLARQKQRAKILRRWLILVGVLALAAIAAGLVAYQNAQEANAQRDVAFKNGQEAQAQRDVAARRSTELSQTLGSSYFKQGSAALRDPRTARQGLAYLARAVREHQHPTAAIRLLTFLQQRTLWQLTPAEAETQAQQKALQEKASQPARQQPPAPEPGQGTATTPAPAPSPAQTEPPQDQPKLPATFTAPKIPGNTEPGMVGLIVRSDQGRTAVTWHEDVESEKGSNHAGAGLHHFRVWDAKGKPITPWIKADFAADSWVGDISGITFSPDGDYLAVRVERWRQPEYLQVWHLPTGKQVGQTLEATGPHPDTQGAAFTHVAFTPAIQNTGHTLRHLITGSSRGDSTLLAISYYDGSDEPEATPAILVSHLAPITTAEYFPQGPDGHAGLFVSASRDGEVRFKNPATDSAGRDSPSLQLDEPVTAILPAKKVIVPGSGTAPTWPTPAIALHLRTATRTHLATPYTPLALAPAQPKALPQTPAPGQTPAPNNPEPNKTPNPEPKNPEPKSANPEPQNAEPNNSVAPELEADTSQRKDIIPEEPAEGAPGSLIDVGTGKITFPETVLHAYLQASTPPLLTLETASGHVHLLAIQRPHIIPLATAHGRELILDPEGPSPQTLPLNGTPIDLCLTLSPQNRAPTAKPSAATPGAASPATATEAPTPNSTPAPPASASPADQPASPPPPTAASLLQGARLTVTTKDYLYQVLDLSTHQWLSRPIDEKPLFPQGGQASEYGQQWVSPDGRTLLTRSHHWEPPNALLSWLTLWDLPTGEPLTDRVLIFDEGLDEISKIPTPYLAPHTASLSETAPLLYHAPATLYPTLAALAESFAHLTLTPTNDLQPTPETTNEATTHLLQTLRDLTKDIAN